MLKKLFDFLSSLRLTVACLSCAIVLVFVGTLAQVEQGLFLAQERYFASLFVWWSPGEGAFKLPVFPAGYLLGSVLLLNLLAAHYKRFSFSGKKVGISMIHSGIVLLLLGQLFTQILQVESQMRLVEGSSSNFSVSGRSSELAVIDASGKESDRVVSISEQQLRKSAELTAPVLPFNIQIEEYFSNSSPTNAPPSNAELTPNTQNGVGRTVRLIREPATVRMDMRNMPAAVVELKLREDGKSLGTWLVSSWLDPQSFEVDGKPYRIALRPKRYYKPFNLSLIDFSHDKYQGTEIAKNFSSRVRLLNAGTGEDREALIYMNHPLRYQGETYYQGSFDPRDDRVSILQVVRNPAWITPYLGCIIVGTGLIVQFLSHLVGFAKRRRKA